LKIEKKALSRYIGCLKRGGSIVCSGTSINPAKHPLNKVINFNTKFILPAIGNYFFKDRSASTYVIESAATFPHGMAFNNILNKLGLWVY